jgi:quinol-cytochrome oxidoreductase complex cytochrome b subunit
MAKAQGLTRKALWGRAEKAMGGGWEWLDDRLGISELNYDVPAHAQSIWYMLGGITGMGFLILVATGIYLTQFYNPDPNSARDSVVYITNYTEWGQLVRSLHFWTANLVMVTVLLHMIRVFATGAYKPPREVNWLVGLGLLGVTLGMLFTGTVLKWDQEGWEALLHNQGVGKFLGGPGGWFADSFTRSVPILGRLYVAHIIILPAMLFGLLALHFWLVKRHGISSLPGHEEDAPSGKQETDAAIRREGASPFLSHVQGIWGYGMLLLVVAGGGALVMNAPLGQVIVKGPEVSKPGWMFLPFYPLENVWGLKALLWAPVVVFGLLALVPFVDRGRSRRLGNRKLILAAGFILLATLVALGLYGHFSAAQSHVMGGM